MHLNNSIQMHLHNMIQMHLPNANVLPLHLNAVQMRNIFLNRIWMQMQMQMHLHLNANAFAFDMALLIGALFKTISCKVLYTKHKLMVFDNNG